MTTSKDLLRLYISCYLIFRCVHVICYHQNYIRSYYSSQRRVIAYAYYTYMLKYHYIIVTTQLSITYYRFIVQEGHVAPKTEISYSCYPACYYVQYSLSNRGMRACTIDTVCKRKQDSNYLIAKGFGTWGLESS